MRKLPSSDNLRHFTEVLINGVWLPYCECRVVPDDTIDPNTIKPCVAFPVKVLGVGVFEVRIDGMIQDRLTRTHYYDGTPYTPETHIYWGLV